MTEFDRHFRAIVRACSQGRIDREQIVAAAALCGRAEIDLLVAKLDGLDDADLMDGAGDVADFYWRLRTSYAEVLAGAGGPAVDAMIEALRSVNPRTRSHVASALGAAGAGRAFGPLVAALADEADDTTRLGLLEALGRLRNPAAFDVLVPYLSDHSSNGWPARVAAGALGRLGDPRAVGPLAALLRAADDWFVRLGAAEGLRHLNHPAAADALRAAAHDPDPRVRKEVLGALRDLPAAPAAAAAGNAIHRTPSAPAP